VREQIQKQFENLIKGGREMLAACGWNPHTLDRFQTYPSPDQYNRFRTQAMNLVRAGCGQQSDHYQSFRRFVEKHSDTDSSFLPDCLGFLEAAYADLSAGVVVDPELRATADVLTDFVGLARHALEDKAEGAKNVAAVLAAAAFEDFCADWQSA
jgi:hypothetical protein